MDKQTLLKTGVAGTVVVALCCATPILVILFGVIGLSAWVGWLDYVLIPALVVFIAITIYALHRRRVAAACCAAPGQTKSSRQMERGDE
jgi:mercuric ion transport protein